MQISLAEAARRTGLSKPTVQRAIKKGTLSASRNEDGSYSIDLAELARVYNLDPLHTGHEDRHMKRDEPPILSGGLQVEVAVLRERLAAMGREREEAEERYQLASSQIDDLRRRLDAEAEARRMESEERRKLTAILTDQRAKEPTPAPQRTEQAKGWRGLLHRLAG